MLQAALNQIWPDLALLKGGKVDAISTAGQ
jgi:hypothetical protein